MVSSKTHSELLHKLKEKFEENIIKRIETGNFDINDNKKYSMEQLRAFQLIEILRRVKTEEMSKLKFMSNFGVNIHFCDVIRKKIYFENNEEIQKSINEFDNENIVLINLYLNYCYELLKGNKIHKGN